MLQKDELKILWDKIRNEDDLDAFKNLHSLYYAKLCDFSFLYLKDKLPCEEVVSDVFVTIWNKRKELRNINNIQSYIYKCTRNLSIDLLRKNSRTIDLETELFEVEEIKHDHDLFAEYDMKEFRMHLQGAVDKLPAQCKLIFRMLLNDNLSCAEIAETLNLSKKTIETQISIAYRKLIVILKRIYEKDLCVLYF